MLNISDFPWAECRMIDERIIYQKDNLALRRKTRKTDVLRYSFEFITISMDLDIGRSVKAKLSAAAADVIQYVHPRLSYCMGTDPVEGLTVFGSMLKGQKTVTLTSTGVWQLKAGDYFQFNNHTKVYEAAEDTLLTSGSQIVNLTSPLIANISNGANVTVDGVTWHLISNGVIEASMEASNNQDMELTLIAVEDL